jgi:predicted nucleic acid-binding protein
MEHEPVVLDTDTLSELSRDHPVVRERALAYLAGFGRLTITAITVFERLRGYRLAIREGKPFERQLQAFEALVANCIVLPFDQEAASVAADIWSRAARGQRQHLGDILIAAIAVSRQLPLVIRNRRDFEPITNPQG